MHKQIYGGDVATAYLTGEQRTDLSAYIPPFGQLYALPMSEILKLRNELKVMAQGMKE